MAEKDRKPGQNGKGSDSRVSDIKTYHSNWQKINWKNPRKLKSEPAKLHERRRSE